MWRVCRSIVRNDAFGVTTITQNPLSKITTWRGVIFMELVQLLEEFKFNCECRRLSEQTISNYCKQVGYLMQYAEGIGVVNAEGITARHIRNFLMEKRKQGCRPSYINDLLKAFKVFFRYAQEERYIESSPAAEVKNMRAPKIIIRTFDKSEIKRMLDCYQDADFLSVRNKTILVLLFDTGIRLNELVSLTDTDIHEDYILIHGKGDKERVVPKSPILSLWLMKYIRTRNAFFHPIDRFDALFVSRYRHSLSRGMVEKIVFDAGTAANVREDIRISPHTIRHCFAQQQLRNGLDIYSLSRILGHTNISITQQYLEGIRDKEILKSAQSTSTLMNL